jgi:hypothetical protein
VYPVIEVLKAAQDGSTIALSIANPATDITLSAGVPPIPNTQIAVTSSTTVTDDELTQTGFHIRNNDGSEVAATSRTGGLENTSVTALQKEIPIRLRFGVANLGSTSTFPIALQLEYATTAATCSDSLGWIDVGSIADDWDMSDSTFLAEGANTTDIATSTGGVTNGNTDFLTPNGGVRDVSSVVATLTFLPTNFTEVEFSITSSSTTPEGQTYCFRLSNAGTALSTYADYPRITISSDVTVQATGTPVSSITIPTTSIHTGDVFTFVESTASRSVTSITLTETGTVDASAGLAHVRLHYDVDTSAPYNCASESYGGAEPQFGATSTDGFSTADGIAVFTDAVTITPTQALCVYPVLEVTAVAQHSETIDLSIASPATDVVVSGGGSIGPATAVSTVGSTTLEGGIVRQYGYHWRSDNGNEVLASSTVGAENTPLGEFTLSTPVRVRFLVDNIGPVTAVPTQFRIEYGVRLTSCENISVWTDVGAAPDAWDMYDSPHLTDAADTTDISTTTGGISNPGGKTFLSPNGGIKDLASQTGAITLSTTDFAEVEYSLTSTASTSYATNYCFRLTNAGTPVPEYTEYAELTTVVRRDFRVQRGTTIVTGTNAVVAAGSAYMAPASSSSAFVRITNMHHTGAGRTVGDNTQEANIVTAYIENPSNLTTSFTIRRASNSATQNTVVAWEIVEFIGEPGTDNEMIVREQSTVSLTGVNQVATGTAVAGVTGDNVVVFVTGSSNANTGASAYFAGQVTSKWNASTSQPVFERIGAGSTANVSYAVVEFTGINWKVQRVEHVYQVVNETKTESIAPVNSPARTFLHTQKRMGAVTQQASFGHEVWLSSIGRVSFRLPLNAATTSGQVSVAWVIENTQSSEGKMVVQRIGGSVTGGVEPRTAVIGIDPVSATNNTSVFAMSAFQENTTNYPRVLGAVTLASTTAFTIFSGEITAATPYLHRTEIVEWPTTGLAVRQNYYRFYVDNDLLTPTDPWPPGPSDVGENTSITALDEPVAEGDRVRVRVALTVDNANLSAGLRTYTLQYGLRDSTCSAIETWTNVGAVGSGEIWRGAALSVSNNTALSGNPPTPGDLLLSVSDVAGRLVTESPSLANPFDAAENDAIEYDFVVEHNGAAGSSFYCFRVVNSDGELLDGYVQYPQLRTAGFTPVISRWRWYGDPLSVTPTAALAGEQITPIDIGHATSVALRVSVAELKSVDGLNTKFRVQYSEYPDFRIAYEVAPSSTCQYGDVWCYAESGGVNNTLIPSALLSDTDSCVAGVGEGCGTFNEDGVFAIGDTHSGGATREYQFTLQTAGIRTNATYYFRLYDVTNDLPLLATTTYPSVSTEGAVLTFQVDGMPASTTVAGQVTAATTSATTIAFGSLPMEQSVAAAQRLTVFTNGTEGYQVFLDIDGPPLDVYGNALESVASTNASPQPWVTACAATSTSCFGYHTTDSTLLGGSTRFALNDSYAGVETEPVEVMASGVPVTFDVADILFRTRVGFLQPAGDYQTTVQYIIVPRF